MIYNVLCKGFSVGMTFKKDEALSWCTGPGYEIQERKYK